MILQPGTGLTPILRIQTVIPWRHLLVMEGNQDLTMAPIGLQEVGSTLKQTLRHIRVRRLESILIKGWMVMATRHAHILMM